MKPTEATMSPDELEQKQAAAHKASLRHLEHEAEGGVSGAIAGAVLGSVAGPPGAAAGAVIGAVVGTLAANALEGQATDAADKDRKLDDAIGITGGEMGAPNLAHPPATRGVYSGESAGADGGGADNSDAAEGPMQVPS
jgi:hypothetical protein